jgi:hypothetical protein
VCWSYWKEWVQLASGRGKEGYVGTYAYWFIRSFTSWVRCFLAGVEKSASKESAETSWSFILIKKDFANSYCDPELS